MQREVTSIFGEKKVVLGNTFRAVTPSEGLSVFVKFLEKLGCAATMARHLPIQLESPDAIAASHMYFIFSVLSGALRLAQAALVRAARPLERLLEIAR